VIDDVTIGVSAGDRIGVVGRNGGGKSTLLRLLAAISPPDDGRVTRGGDVRIGYLGQTPPETTDGTIRDRILGDVADHTWATDARIRSTLTGLLGGYASEHLDRPLAPLSGGERQRVELARLLVEAPDVLLLDEPTNHLDVEAVAWLADTLTVMRETALVVVTHDRWFLDAVSDRTWEVVQGRVEEYEGGYSAYVLAKAERARQNAAMEARRNNLLRKELAWLRRGAPARTSKPKFRIDAANALIDAEPPPRDDVDLTRFASARLGRQVYELHDASVSLGGRQILDRVTWDIGPGDRVGILGPNGAGKSTLLSILARQRTLDSGRLAVGQTVVAALLSQRLEEVDPSLRVLEAVEHVARVVDLGSGRELTASQLCERLGFDGTSQWTRVGDLSGGERRRLQLTRLLMAGPNVVMLDEPTNDFDVEILAALEDLLDGFAGTLLIVSHDRYFLERVCTTFRALPGDGTVRDLPGGIDQYLALRAEPPATLQVAGPDADTDSTTPASPASLSNATSLSGGERRALEKQAASLERRIAKQQDVATDLHHRLIEFATDTGRLLATTADLRKVEETIAELETEWYDVIDRLG
jgi:ATP-binding cassette subfamily F protein uup